ncbi:MAG: PrsW family intramembrane metalloprotease [Betaproteobacteria bacterium]
MLEEGFAILLTVLVAVAIPAAFLYFLHWLDLYGSDRPRIVVLCVAWGAVAFLLSFLANRFVIDVLGFSRAFVGTRTAPFVEEMLKSLVLFYLVRQARLTYFLDGAIYGFASGIGFAIIENLRYTQLFPENPFALVIVRDFSSALAHGTATAMTGIALGGFMPSARGSRGVRHVLLGLAAAMTLHYLWNNLAFYSTLGRIVTEWIFVGVGLAGVALIASAILWGLRRERFQLLESLDMKVGVSEEEASVVQHMGDLNRLLAPIEQRFGKLKRKHVAEFLHLEAQLGLAQQRAATTTDATLRAELAAQVAGIEERLNQERRNVGVYVMLYVRSIFPATRWSLWARLGQTLARESSHTSNVWTALDARLAPASMQGGGLYARLRRGLDLRARATSPAMARVHELPEALQKCMHWVMKEMTVTAQHVAAGLGHHEAHAHEMLKELVARGFLHHHAAQDGRATFRTRVGIEDGQAAGLHIWRSSERRTTTHHEGIDR